MIILLLIYLVVLLYCAELVLKKRSFFSSSSRTSTARSVLALGLLVPSTTITSSSTWHSTVPDVLWVLGCRSTVSSCSMWGTNIISLPLGWNKTNCYCSHQLQCTTTIIPVLVLLENKAFSKYSTELKNRSLVELFSLHSTWWCHLFENVRQRLLSEREAATNHYFIPMYHLNQ